MRTTAPAAAPTKPSWQSGCPSCPLALRLESGGTRPGRTLTPDDLRGLPVPDEVWA